jgi:DNA-binding PucR family transcriptional regulator
MVPTAGRRPRTPSVSDGSNAALDAEFAALAHRLMAERRDDFIRHLFDSLAREISELTGDARLTSLFEAAVTENIVSMVNFLERGTSVADLDATSAALAHARTLAQRDIPLSALFRAYRLGHVQFIDLGLELIHDSPTELRGALSQALVRRSADFIDKVCEQVGSAYETERDQWMSERGGIRQHWVGEILSGRPLDAATAESVIGYRLTGTHLGVQMWTSSDLSEARSRSSFERVRRVLTGLVRPVKHPLVVPRDEHEMHVWFPVRPEFALRVDELASAFKSQDDPHLHVVIGRPQPGIDGFRLTMKQATRVRDLVLASSKPPPALVTYDQLGSVALMTSDIEALKQFVIHTLGPLAERGEREDYLRATLRSFLAHNCGYLATAEDLVLHRNTVRYRINQALELCGRDLADISVDFNIQVALNAAHWLGEAVLAD